MTKPWQQLTPLEIQQWCRQMIPALGVEKVAAEVQKLSDRFDEIALPNPCLSVLVCKELTAHLPPPKGWSASELEAFERLPFWVAKVVTTKRDQDNIALRRLQNLNAEIRKRKETKHAHPEKTASAAANAG